MQQILALCLGLVEFHCEASLEGADDMMKMADGLYRGQALLRQVNMSWRASTQTS